MASELGAAYISVGLGTNKLTGDIKKAFGGAGSSAASGGKAAGSKFAAGFKGLVVPALAAVGVAGIASFIGGTIKSAGALEQSVGAIDSVFKGSAGQIHGWAKSAAGDVGLTQNEFNELGTVIGSQLKNGGTAMDELAPKTNNLIGLGADMAAMFGGTTKDAVGAISAALRGERDTIEKYGVSLTQAAVDAKAAELGFTKVGGALSQEASQAATLALVMEQTSDAHGTFAKEANTYSGQVQRLSAGWGDLKSSIGTLFLPVMTAAVSFITASVIPALSGFVDMIGSGGLAGAFGPLMAVIGPVFQTLGDVFASLGPQIFELVQAFSPLSLIFQALQPVLPVILGLVTELATVFGSVLGTVLTTVTPIVESLVGVLSGVLVAVLPVAAQLLTQLATVFSTQIMPAVLGVVTALAPLVVALISQLAPIITRLVSSVLPPLITIFTAVITAIAPLITQLADLLIPIIKALMPVVVTVFGYIADVITSAMKVIQGIIQVVTGIISGNWSQVWTGIKTVLSGVWDYIKAVVKGAINIVLSVIRAVLSIIQSSWSGAWNAVTGVISDAWESIKSAVSGGIDDVLGFMGDLPGNIMSALGDLGGLLLDAGASLMQGFLDGITGMVGTIKDAVGGVMDTIRDFFPFSPAKTGPFSGRGYTSYSGKALVSDFAAGMESQKGLARNAANAVTSAAQLSSDAYVSAADSNPFENSSGSNITVNGVPMDQAEKVASAIGFEMRRINSGGKYVGV